MAILEIVGTASFLALLLTVFGAIRRLFFHPLAHIPGPRLAALTWWYEFYFDVVQRGRYVFKIQELHNQYGPIIRVTPDELYVSDVGFLDTVYAPSSSRREKYEYQLRTLRVPGGVGTSVGHDAHRKRREALSPFFSKRNVLHLEPLITQKIEELCQVIKKHSVAKTPVNLSDMFFAFSNEQCHLELLVRPSDGYSIGRGEGCSPPALQLRASEGNQYQQTLSLTPRLPGVSPFIHKQAINAAWVD